ncbi:hypothetical protein C4J81_05625 [Deltaproteobacteria bacterium Smac51]|nr:hypothetical protein C4J81_05625 [Deltaproteobacteria bacterium Smac51]
MKKIILTLAAVLIMSTPGMAGAGPLRPDPIELNIKNIEQETNYWCWASLIQQLVVYHSVGRPPAQCDMVSLATGNNLGRVVDCCQNRDAEECHRTGNLVEVMELVTRYGGRASVIPIPNEPEEIYNLLASGQALIVGFQMTPELNHAYLIKGISWVPTDDGNDQAILLINDPAYPGSQSIPFDKAQPTWITAIAAD